MQMAKKKRRGDPVEEKKEGPTSLFILRESNIVRRLTKVWFLEMSTQTNDS